MWALLKLIQLGLDGVGAKEERKRCCRSNNLAMISLVLLGAGMFYFLRRYAPEADEIIGTAALTVNGLMIFEYARTAQPDLLLTLFCFASFAVFIADPRSKWNLTGSALLMGAAILTKGYGPVFFYPGLAIHSFMCEEKPAKRLGRLAAHAGLAMILPVAWATAVILQNDMSSLLSTLGSEVMLRTHGRMGFFEHLLVFPPKFIYYLMPWPVVLLFFWKHIRWVSSPVYSASALIFLTSFLVYWLLPGGKERYLLPAVPMLFVCMAHWFQKDAVLPMWFVRLMQSLIFCAVVVAGGFMVGRDHIGALFFVLPSIVGLITWYMYKKNRADLHLVAMSIMAVLFFENCYYQLKGLEGPDPEPAVAEAAAAMPDMGRAWVVEHAFNSEILASTFACRTGRLPYMEGVARDLGLMQKPFYKWSRRDDVEGCSAMAEISYEKEKRNPFYVLDCRGEEE
jgi:hypothetical protein